MRRSAEQNEKQEIIESEASGNQKANKIPSDNRTSNIAILDNDTMVEVYKYLNYCGLANNNLVSKRFCDLIQTHRHKLAMLYVDRIAMECVTSPPTAIEIFDEELSPEEYTEWIICNDYSKQVSLEGQASEKQIAHDRKVYELIASAYYNGPDHRWNDKTYVLFARAELNHENWPLFQHFVRLLTDPFVSIGWIELTAQNDVLNLLTGAMNPDRCRIQCRGLTLNLEENGQKFIHWVKNKIEHTKDRMFCNEFTIYNDRSHNCGSNYDRELLDLFVTGAPCTSSITLMYFDLSNVLPDLVQKFMDLKSYDENQMVESIHGNVGDRWEFIMCNFESFFLKKEQNGNFERTMIFQFCNNDVGKKLMLSVTTSFFDKSNSISLKIDNL